MAQAARVAHPSVVGRQKQHHYVPSTYLAGFTASGTKGDRLYCLDLTRGKVFPKIPDELASERDLYAFELDEDPLCVEKMLGTIEGEAATVLRAVASGRDALTADEAGVLAAFVAFLAVRTPAQRDKHCRFWADTARVMVRANADNIPGLTREEALETAEWIQGNPTHWVKAMVGLGRELMTLLERRYWTVALLADETPDLLCSDRPVFLVDGQTGDLHVDGFGQPQLSVFMPLSRRAMLRGAAVPHSVRSRVPPDAGAVFNEYIAAAANRWIFSRERAPLDALVAAAKPAR